MFSTADWSFLWSTIPARSKYCWLPLLSHWAIIFYEITLAANSVFWSSMNATSYVRILRIGLEWAFPSRVPSDWRFRPPTFVFIMVSPIESTTSVPTHWSYVSGSASSSSSRIAGGCLPSSSLHGSNYGVPRLSSSGLLEKSLY